MTDESKPIYSSGSDQKNIEVEEVKLNEKSKESIP